MLTKRGLIGDRFIKLAGVLMTAALVIGGLSTAGKTATKIEFWTNQTQEERMAKYRSFARAFEKEHPDYAVEIVPYGEEAEFAMKWVPAKMAGELPQVVEAEMWQAYEIIFDNAGMPEVAEAVIKELGEWDFFKFPLDFVSWEGAYHAVPSSVYGDAVFSRRDIFEESGIEPFGEVVSLDRILNTARKLHRPEERLYGITVQTSKEYHIQYLNYFANAIGADLFDKEGNVLVNSTEREEWIELFTYMRDLSAYTQPGPQTNMDAFHNFIGGTTGIAVAPSFLPRYIESTDPSVREVTDITWTISAKKPASFFLACAYIPIRGMSPEQAEGTKEWLKYLMSGATRVGYLDLVPGGFNPVRKSILYSEEYLGTPVRKKWGAELFVKLVEATNEAAFWGRLSDGTVITEIGEVIWSFAIQEERFNVCEEGKSPEDAVESIEKKLNYALGR